MYELYKYFELFNKECENIEELKNKLINSLDNIYSSKHDELYVSLKLPILYDDFDIIMKFKEMRSIGDICKSLGIDYANLVNGRTTKENDWFV